jgi:hypothetical protein
MGDNKNPSSDAVGPVTVEPTMADMMKEIEYLKQQLKQAQQGGQTQGPSVSSSPPSNPNSISNDPKYSKYFKMLAMQLPRAAIEIKMMADGLTDFSILDIDPDDPHRPRSLLYRLF